MPRGRSDLSSAFTARIPRELEDMVEAYAQVHDISFSEAIRRLLVRALEELGATHTVDRGLGPHEDRGWTEPSE